MRIELWWSVGVLALIASGCGGEDNGIEQPNPPHGRMLIVSGTDLRVAAEAYGAYRKTTGLDVQVVTVDDLTPTDSTLVNAVAERIRRFADEGPADQQAYVLIIADAEHSDPQNTNLVPVASALGEVGDGPYVDLDADGIPDLPIGRLPFRQARQVESYLERVRRYESTPPPGPWNKTISAFAGAGGFGEDIDGVLELAATLIFDDLSYDFDISMTYASPSSNYYLPPSQWAQEYTERCQAGAVIQPYIGHTKGSVVCCTDSSPQRRGLLAFFSCSDGTFHEASASDPHASLAEDLLLREQGPVATLAATDLSHPYGNAILSRELGHAVVNLREPTYGRALTVAMHNTVHRIDDLRRSIDSLAEEFTDEPLPVIIATHAVMYNLLGDPALPIHLPSGTIRIEALPGRLEAGQTVSVKGRVFKKDITDAMESGSAEITLEVPRTRIAGEIIPREPTNHDPDLCRHNHAVANDKVVARATSEVVAGDFSAELEIPHNLSAGRYHLKIYALDEEADAVASQRVELQQP